MRDTARKAQIEARYEALRPLMSEGMKRRWAAAEARAMGWSGITAVHEATGISITTIRKGIKELEGFEQNPESLLPMRSRRAGGGRKRATDKDPGLAQALENLVDPVSRGDPQSPLRWTCKSTPQLARELSARDHPVSATTVGRLLKESGYSLQGLSKNREGSGHPDRNAQFEHINSLVQDYQAQGLPAISVDAKKKELVGDFKNGGREWQPKGEPDEVLVHDFVDKKLGKAIPYGVYDLSANQGWVSVGVDHDTARFAAQAIRRWWQKIGKKRYPKAKKLLITADAGGSNGSRNRLWKLALQELADELALEIQVCHFPPGTSKWNKIEHRMFSQITQNWRGRALVSIDVIISLIANTTTRTGLTIQAELDSGLYPTGIVVSDQELASVNIQPADFHGEWNYLISPGRVKI